MDRATDFKGLLGTPEFVVAAYRVKMFFDRNNDCMGDHKKEPRVPHSAKPHPCVSTVDKK